MEERKVRVAITHGDTNGIGYEIILKAFEDPMMLELCTPIIYGSPKVATYHRNAMKLSTQFSNISKAEDARDGRLNLLATFDDEVKVEFGTPTPESAEAARKALQRAKEDLKQNLYDVLVQAPVVSSNTPDREDRSLLVMFADDIRIALVTNHLPLKEVAQSISQEKIIEKATLFHTSLKRDFRINNPRIAVLALNPRCGEDGVLGDEEQTIINPAIKELAEQGIQVFGPYAADDFFGRCAYYRFDGVLAMYHDQGQTPFKAVAYENGVRFTAGLDLIRTAPAHGVNFNAAGKNTTDEQSLRNAIYVAIDVWRNRQNFDEPYENPLPKLYHERRDESEKVRFHKKPEE